MSAHLPSRSGTHHGAAAMAMHGVLAHASRVVLLRDRIETLRDDAIPTAIGVVSEYELQAMWGQLCAAEAELAWLTSAARDDLGARYVTESRS